jgi:hypothetical protein
MKARCKKELTFDGFTFKVDKEYDFEEKVVYLPAEESDVVLARGNRTRHLQYATHIDAVMPTFFHKTEKVPMTLFFYDRQYCIKKKWRAKGFGPLGFGGGMLLCFEDWFVESDFGSSVNDEFGLEAIFKKRNEEMLAQMNPEDYNGGISVMDVGILKLPLPVPEKGKKWAVRWHDTPSGELLPELKQVPTGEPNIEWREGYPKYK